MSRLVQGVSFRAGCLPTALHARGVLAGAVAIFTIATWRQLWTAGAHSSSHMRSTVNRWRQ